MPKGVREMLQNGQSFDEPDRMPNNITITNLDILMYIVAIIGHFVDLGLDINIAVQYSLSKKLTEFGWTVAFILIPAFVNTAVSVRMYSQDKQQDSVSNEFNKRRWLRVIMLMLQLAPVLRFMDALIYAIKSRQAEKEQDAALQRKYYGLMLKEDSDAALLRIFECFLEAAPQQVLQTCLLLQGHGHLAVHQALSIASSLVGQGWCLAGYQRAVRFAQPDKRNMDWRGSALQTLWHFLVTLSRIMSISAMGYLFPYWTILACCIHILIMTSWLQFYEKPPFCSQNRIAHIAFSLTLGTVYLFTYILPVEGRTRYRYSIYYTICFLQNITCGVLWYVYVEDEVRTSMYFIPVLVLTIVPFVLGILIMIIYYIFLHPTVRKVGGFRVSFKSGDVVSQFES